MELLNWNLLVNFLNLDALAPTISAEAEVDGGCHYVVKQHKNHGIDIGPADGVIDGATNWCRIPKPLHQQPIEETKEDQSCQGNYRHSLAAGDAPDDLHQDPHQNHRIDDGQ